MFHETVGFLPLSWVNVGSCLNDYHPGQPSIPQLYALLSKGFCPAEGFMAAFQGQFVVSQKQINKQSLETYRYLLVSCMTLHTCMSLQFWNYVECLVPCRSGLPSQRRRLIIN